jgi:hypothetical protein
MKKKITSALLCILSFVAFSQNDRCGSDQIREELIRNDPEFKKAFLAFESQLQKDLKNAEKSKTKKTIYTIPLVVHVIHIGEAIGQGSNISDAQIHSAIDALNNTYKNVNGIGVDIEMQFCLASRDPNGNATSGINRVDGSSVPRYSTLGIAGGCCAEGAKEDSVKRLSRWPVSDYYNIWVVRRMCGNCAGYAYPPTGLPSDGTVIQYLYMSNFNSTLSHELGHGFALYHTFQGDNGGTSCPVNNVCSSDGDHVCDTPPHKQNDCGSPNPCTNEGVWENTQHNYMSYCNFLDRFTQGQKERMRAAAEIAPRLSLLSSLGCSAPCNVPNTPGPISGNSLVCSATTNTYSIASVNEATSYQWILPSGWTGNSTTTSIVTTVNTNSGNISVKAINACGTSSQQTLAVKVNAAPATPSIAVSGLQLSSSSSVGNQWYLNGTLIAGATMQNYNAVANGTYVVVVSMEACTSATSAPVVINVTGLENFSSGNYIFTIYPNPNEGTFQITFNTSIASNYKLEIFNAVGQLIFKEELSNFSGDYNKKLSVAEHGKGMYSVSLTNSKEETVKKVVVY